MVFKLEEKCHSEIVLRSFFVLNFPLSLSTVKFCWYLTKAVISGEKKNKPFTACVWSGVVVQSVPTAAVCNQYLV